MKQPLLSPPRESDPNMKQPHLSPPREPDPNEGVPPVRLVKDTWEGHMNDMVDNQMRPMVNNVLSTRSFDWLRQIVASFFCGILCFPCACARLTGHYTGYFDPMNVTIGGKKCAIPGLELCSAPDCSQICGDERGYGHNEYTRSQAYGSGFSRLNLDKLNLVGGAALSTVIIVGCVQH